MTLSEFIKKWSKVQLTERSAAQQHFLELCEVFEHPRPADVDPTGQWYTFEKGVAKHGGGKGWADVWKRQFFAWEYKGKHKNLDAAQTPKSLFSSLKSSIAEDDLHPAFWGGEISGVAKSR